MSTYTFRLTLDIEGKDFDEGKMTDILFNAGCDDALLGSTDGVVHLDFDREATSLGEAVASALKQVESVGGRVLSIDSSFQEHEETSRELDFLQFTYDTCDFGPSHEDVMDDIKRLYLETGKKLPEGYEL